MVLQDRGWTVLRSGSYGPEGLFRAGILVNAGTVISIYLGQLTPTIRSDDVDAFLRRFSLPVYHYSLTRPGEVRHSACLVHR
jgi:hypothetical protein